MPEARVGKRLDFDGNEPVTCALPEANRKGVQIVAEGFNIEDAVIKTISAMGAETIVDPPTGKTGIKHAIVARHFALKGVEISGLTPGGSYAVTVIV